MPPQRGSPMPWKLPEGRKTKVDDESCSFTMFYSDEPVEDVDVTCWLAPEDDANGQFICARDLDLCEKGKNHDDSY